MHVDDFLIVVGFYMVIGSLPIDYLIGKYILEILGRSNEAWMILIRGQLYLCCDGSIASVGDAPFLG